MKILSSLILILILSFITYFLFVPKSSSDELQDINQQISNLTNALNLSINATKPLESQLNALQAQINSIKARISAIEQDLAVKKKNIDNGYANLAREQVVLNKTIRDFYIKSYYNSPLLVFLSAPSASKITQILAYQKAATDQDKVIITNIALSIADLEGKSENLKNEQALLTSAKANLDIQSAKLDKIVSGAKAYQSTLFGQIAVLSAKQQQILNQRLAGLNIPLSAYAGLGAGCSSDLTNGKDPGFGNGFGLFTYGVPNRVGLNQYGAKGRAEAGQNAKTILASYYNADYVTGYNTGINIHVVGANEYGQSFDDNWNIEDYLKHIYEVPTNWPEETLRAQAIAARSYALAYTNNGSGSICPSQSCQVAKREENSDAWKKAVSDTSGIVLTSGGQPIKAWFSSTHGGYVYSSGDIGWSGTPYTKRQKDATGSVNSFADLQSSAYDKGSPWFYCDWGSRSQYGKTAWLKGDEISDIVNVLLLAQRDSSTKEHLYQTDKPNPAGTDTWDEGRVKQELTNRGINPFNSISNISVGVDFGSGQTNSVNINGDAGSANFGGSDFKAYFNLRAPANIQIVGPLYNVERK